MHSANLLQLAAHLDTVQQAEFDMSDFRSDPLLIYPITVAKYRDRDICGTAGCAIGHAPAAGFPIHSRDLTWFEYSERIFGLDHESDEWEYLFGTRWFNHDNTPGGAADRIREFVTKGVPWGWNLA